MAKEEDQTNRKLFDSYDAPTSFSSSMDESDKRCCPAGTQFEIRVRGHLDSKWSNWLEGMEVKLLEDGETIFTGPIADQSALMGILNKLSRLNLTLISINQIDRRQNEYHSNEKP